jgi:hypothetical protein
MDAHEAVDEPDHPRPDVVPVDRRRFGLDRTSIGPALLALALALVMGLGIAVVDAFVPEDDEVRPGDVIGLAGGVEFVPVAGWSIADGLRVGQAGSGDSYPSTAQMTNGALSLQLQTGPWTDDAPALLEQVRSTNASTADDGGPRVEGEVIGFRTTSGADGVLTRYRSPNTDGLLAALVITGADGPVGVEVIASGPVDAPDTVAQDVAAMIESIAPIDRSAR